MWRSGLSENRDELLNELERDPPAYFVILRNDYLEHVTGVKMDSLEALKRFPELVQFLKANYELETVIEGFTILRRTRSGTL